MAKNIFIAATDKDIGKSTISFAIIDKLISSNFKVGFMKPVGQRWLPSKWGEVEEDVILMKNFFDFSDSPIFMNPVVIKKGYTEEYLNKMIKPDLGQKIIDAYEQVAIDKDYIVIEGTGHGGVGSVLDKSNADVAKILDAKVILLAKGGIGSTIDKLELNRVFFESKGAQVIGIIVNKVIESKIQKVRLSIEKYCKKNNLKLYGIIPYSPILSNPTLGQVIDELKPEILHETNEQNIVVDNFFVAATNIDEFIEFFRGKKGNVLLVFPSVRLDIVFAIPNLKKFCTVNEKKIFAVLFSGDKPPSEIAVKTLIDEDINILWQKGDTFSVISKLSKISIKTRYRDNYKINEIRKIVIKNVSYNAILSKLSSAKIQKTKWRKIKQKFVNFFKKFRKNSIIQK